MSFCMDFFVQLHRICLRSCVFNVLLFSHTFIYTLFLYPLTRDGRTMVSVFMRLCQKRFSANSLSVSCVCVFFFSVCLNTLLLLHSSIPLYFHFNFLVWLNSFLSHSDSQSAPAQQFSTIVPKQIICINGFMCWCVVFSSLNKFSVISVTQEIKMKTTFNDGCCLCALLLFNAQLL